MNQLKSYLEDPTTLALLFSIFAFITGFICSNYIKPLLKKIKKSELLILIFLLSGCHTVTPSNVDQNMPVDFVLNIIDKTPPVITLTNDHLEYIEGEQNQIDFDELIIINDNMDHNLQYQISGEYDLNVAGSYEITIYVEDTSGNSAEKKLFIDIKEKKNEEIPQSERPSNSENNQTTLPENPSFTPSSPSTIPETEYFMFKNGYTMDTAYEACVFKRDQMMSAGKANGGTCTPVMEEGIYTGYQLIYR